MKNRHGYNISQLFNFTQDSYLERTSRPIYGIFFLLPFIIFYELGTILINTDVLNQSQVRVVAFVWLQRLLEYLGLGSKLAWAMPALAVVLLLMGLQLASGKRWRFALGDIWPMVVECILLAVPLIVLSLFLHSSTQRPIDAEGFAKSTAVIRAEAVPESPGAVVSSLSVSVEEGGGQMEGKSLLADIVTGIGAGIYEELIFRLILICVFMLLFQDVLRLSRKMSIILSVLVSAALFSAHHHIVFLDGQLASSAPFNWTEFAFRTIAGIYFAILFAVRGFSITAGTHIFYDIIAVFLNTRFFSQ